MKFHDNINFAAIIWWWMKMFLLLLKTGTAEWERARLYRVNRHPLDHVRQILIFIHSCRVLSLSESGIISKLLKDQTKKAEFCFNPGKQTSYLEPLKIENIYGILILFASGKSNVMLQHLNNNIFMKTSHILFISDSPRKFLIFLRITVSATYWYI